MNNLSDLVDETLIIHQPSVWKSYYELKHSEETLGTMHSKGFLGINMIFKMGNDEWKIYRNGFWKSEIAIKQSGYELPYATYKREGFKMRGIVKFYKGEQMIIDSRILKSEYSIQSLSGECLATFDTKIALRNKTEIHIKLKSELLDKYPWVIILAWYLSLQRRRNAYAG